MGNADYVRADRPRRKSLGLKVNALAIEADQN